MPNRRLLLVGVASGQVRWKIENEHNNTLKTKGYYLEHNFWHGQKHLSSPLETMIPLACRFHTVLGFSDDRYRLVRTAGPSQRTLFQHVSTLTHYLHFPSLAWASAVRTAIPPRICRLSRRPARDTA
jgi:hypothetical protein